jgi:hypothetical protein
MAARVEILAVVLGTRWFRFGSPFLLKIFLFF